VPLDKNATTISCSRIVQQVDTVRNERTIDVDGGTVSTTDAVLQRNIPKCERAVGSNAKQLCLPATVEYSTNECKVAVDKKWSRQRNGATNADRPLGRNCPVEGGRVGKGVAVGNIKPITRQTVANERGPRGATRLMTGIDHVAVRNEQPSGIGYVWPPSMVQPHHTRGTRETHECHVAP